MCPKVRKSQKKTKTVVPKKTNDYLKNGDRIVLSIDNPGNKKIENMQEIRYNQHGGNAREARAHPPLVVFVNFGGKFFGGFVFSYCFLHIFERKFTDNFT